MSTHERQKVCPQVILTGSLSRCSQRRHLSRGFSCLSLSRSLSQSSIPTIFKMVFPPSLVFLHVEIHKLSEQARQGRKTADWLEKIPLRACSNALRWPYADAVGSSEGATIEPSWMWDVWPKFAEHCVEIHYWKVLYIMVSFCFASLWG